MTEIAPFATIAGSLAVAAAAWFLNERSKRTWEEYRRKEVRYRDLLRTVQGFMVGGEDEALKRQFLAAYYECWLYAPDSVIQTVTRFLRRLHVKSNDTADSEKLLGEILLAARRDLVSRKATRKTDLTTADFELFGIAGAHQRT